MDRAIGVVLLLVGLILTGYGVYNVGSATATSLTYKSVFLGNPTPQPTEVKRGGDVTITWGAFASVDATVTGLWLEEMTPEELNPNLPSEGVTYSWSPEPPFFIPGGTTKEVSVTISASPDAPLGYYGGSPTGTWDYEHDDFVHDVNGVAIQFSVVEEAEPVPSHTFTWSAEPAGAGYIIPPSGRTFKEGTLIAVSAEEYVGFEFDHWSGDLSGEKNPINLAMDSDKYVTAHYSSIPIAVRFYLNTERADDRGEMTLKTKDLIIAMETDEALAVDEAWLDISRGGRTLLSKSESLKNSAPWKWSWTAPESGVYSIKGSVSAGGRTYTPLNVQATLGTYYTLTTATKPDEAGTVSPPTGKYKAGTTIEIKASADSGYVFDWWEINARDAGSKNPITLRMNGDKDVFAHFKKIPPEELAKLTVTVEPSGGGSVTPSSGHFKKDSSVELTADPASGYEFSHWSGDASGTSRTISLIMDSDKHVTANFNDKTKPSNLELLSLVAGVVLTIGGVAVIKRR